MSAKHISVKKASVIGAVGSAVNVGIELGAVRYFGGKSPLADAPHQAADVLAYGSVYMSRFLDRGQKSLEKLSSWLVSIGSFAVGAYIAADTFATSINNNASLEPLQSKESIALVSVLAVNGIIHTAQERAHNHAQDSGSLANHVHAQSEWYATAVLLAGTVAATAADAPIAERVVAASVAAWVGYTNIPRS